MKDYLIHSDSPCINNLGETLRKSRSKGRSEKGIVRTTALWGGHFEKKDGLRKKKKDYREANSIIHLGRGRCKG